VRALLLASLLLVPAFARADYDAEGRRDPFVPKVELPGSAPQWGHVRPTALIASAAGDRALLVGGPAGLGVLVRVGDALGGATVRSIDVTRGAVVLEVPEPASLRGVREVSLTLR
jgi:hypothetical protein